MSAESQLPNLDKIFREDEEADFLPSSGSNLAAIFGLQNKAPDAQAPVKQHAQKKQKKSAFQVQASKTEVIIAKPVYAFQLKNDTYMPIGKLGMALAGNVVHKTYQLILYNSKQQHISVATVTPDFMYTVQENNYSSYYDNNNENWSILFESLDISVQFAREIGMARYLSKEGRIDVILSQDLTPIVKDTSAKEGDSISVKYYIITDIVQPFKHSYTVPQTMTVEISTDNSWERVLLGATKGLRRILFLPPSKQISLGPGFPKETNVMLEVEITEIKAPEEKSESARTENSNKATILSRMAKVGQSMLPKIPSRTSTLTSTDSEDTEDDQPEKCPQHKKEPLGVILQKRNILQEHSEGISRSLQKSQHSIEENSSASPTLSSIQTNYGQLSSLQPQAGVLAMPTMMDHGLNLMLSETRMANTELRMGIYKITDNTQKLLDKFHALELQNAASPSTDKLTLDATLKMLLAMNASQVEKKGSESDKENSETSNVPAGCTAEIQELKREMLELKTQLKDTIDCLKEKECAIKNAETENKSLIAINRNLEDRVKELQQSLNSTNEALLKTREDLQEIKSFNKEYHQIAIEIRNKVSNFNALCNPVKSIESIDTLMEKEDIKNKEIKCIMNKTYQSLLEKFDDETYSTDYIKSTIASTIKSVTLLVLGENQEKLEKGSEQASTGDAEEEMEQRECPQVINIPPLIEEINDITTVQDEPPPIPPNDTDFDSD